MLRFYGFHNRAVSIVYNVIRFRNKVLLPKRSNFPADLPILVLNLYCVMVNNFHMLVFKNKFILPTKNRNIS